MEYESVMDIMEIDEPVIVKFERFYQGNIFVDEDMIAYCKFGDYTLDVNISGKTKMNLITLFDLFENQFSIEFYDLIEIYEADDYLDLAKDCIAKIPSKSVRLFCRTIHRQLEVEEEFRTRIDLLDQLLTDSLLSPDELPEQVENCIYHAERNLFISESKRSSKENTIYRFTVPKRVYYYLERPDEFSIRLEFVSSNTKLLFHVMVNPDEGEIKQFEARKTFSNNDGSIRSNFPPTILYNFNNSDGQFELFIRLKGNFIEFMLCDF